MTAGMEEDAATHDIPRLVGADRGDGSAITLYQRHDSTVITRKVSIHPWLLTARPTLPTGTPNPRAIVELTGTLPLRHLVTFETWPDLWSCVRAFLDSESTLRGHRVSSYAELPHIFLLADPVDQWLLQTGSSYFFGMDAASLRRCTLTLSTGETRPRLAEAERPDAMIRRISVRSGKGDQTDFRVRKKDEAGLLRDVLQFIAHEDPDLICGADIHTLVLPYLEKRCTLHGLELSLGRQNGAVHQHPGVPGRAALEIPGRTIIDIADIVPNTELIELFGYFQSRNRRNDPPQPLLSGIRTALEAEPTERTKGVDRFIGELIEALLPVIQSTSVTPGHIFHSGAAMRTDIRMIGMSLRDGISLPVAGGSAHGGPQPESPYRTGMYTSPMEIALVPLQVSIAARLSDQPIRDAHQSLRDPLTDLRASAVKALDKAETLLSPVLYDSAHGWMHACQSRHSRYYHEHVAKEIAQVRRRIQAEAIDTLALHNIRIIQHTDDTMICQVPDNARLSLKTFWSKVQQDLPHDLQVLLLDRFDACVSLGPRIFAVRTGSRTGAHRKSRLPRFFEPFLKDFFSRALECSLEQDWSAFRELYITSLRSIRRHSWHVLDFARQETLGDSFERYDELVQAGKRNLSAAYEAIRETNPQARAGTSVRYYITGSRREITQAEHSKLSDLWDSADPDENTEYYLDRLAQCIERFRILFDPDSFARLFGGEDLFGFDPTLITTIEQASEIDENPPAPKTGSDPSISLDLTPEA